MAVIEVDADAFLAAVESHPELVSVVRPSPREVCEAAATFGLLSDPDSRWFQPAVRA